MFYFGLFQSLISWMYDSNNCHESVYYNDITNGCKGYEAKKSKEKTAAQSKFTKPSSAMFAIGSNLQKSNVISTKLVEKPTQEIGNEITAHFSR